MARSRKLRKRENSPRRKTNKRGKKAQRAKTHKKTARRTRVKAHRPRRNARVTRRRVHRKRGGKAKAPGVAHSAAELKAAYNGKSITHHEKNIAHIKPMVDMSLGDLSGRKLGTTGSSKSSGPKNVKPGSVVTQSQIKAALNEIFPGGKSGSDKGSSSGVIAGEAVGGTAGTVGVLVGLGTYLGKKFAKYQAKLSEAYAQNAGYDTSVTVSPRQYIVKVTQGDKTVFKTFTNKEAALKAAGAKAYSEENISQYIVKTEPEKVMITLKPYGKGYAGFTNKLEFTRNPQTGVLESTDPEALDNAINGMELIDSTASGEDASAGLSKGLKLLKSIAQGNIKAGESKGLIDLLKSADVATDAVDKLQAALEDADQSAVKESDTLAEAEANTWNAVDDADVGVLKQVVSGVEEGSD